MYINTFSLNMDYTVYYTALSYPRRKEYPFYNVLENPSIFY